MSDLYKIAPLGDKAMLIDVGLALSDGLDCSYICDIAIHPEYQGLGLGRNIINQLIELSFGHKK